MTNKQRIINVLKRDGQIDNFAMIDQRITTRLGAVINVLKKEGWDFSGDYIGDSKNFKYVVLKYPQEHKPEMYLRKPFIKSIFSL